MNYLRMTKIQCQTCNWIGLETELTSSNNGEPGCPDCEGTDFLDIEKPIDADLILILLACLMFYVMGLWMGWML